VKKKLPSMYHQFKELADVDIYRGADGSWADLPLRDGRNRVEAETAQSTLPGLFAAGEWRRVCTERTGWAEISLSDLWCSDAALVWRRRNTRRRTSAANAIGTDRRGGKIRAGGVSAALRRGPYAIHAIFSDDAEPRRDFPDA